MLERFERSVMGKVLISILVVVLVAAVVVFNMPASQLRQDVNRYTLPVVDATGLDQDWSIFSDPRTFVAYVDGRIDFADGSTTTSTITTSHWWGAYADYRWQKYEEIIRPDSGARYWPDYAQYLAANARKNGRAPTRVTLIRRFQETLPPGPGPAHGRWRQVTLYVLNLRPPG